MGGGSGGPEATSAKCSGHSKSKCLSSPGVSISTKACKVERSTAICVSQSPGEPIVRLKGCSMAAIRGALTEAVRSGIIDRVIVVNPAASISRCSSPTDQQQIGQAGTKTTTSTNSARRLRIIAGALSSRSCSGCVV